MKTNRWTLVELIGSDIAAWARLWTGRPSGRVKPTTALGLVWTHVGLQATILYRISHELDRRHIRLLPGLVRRLNIVLFGLDIPSSVPIGPGLYIPHPVGTVVMSESIGSNLTLVSGVTIGLRNEPGTPVIGDHVYVGTGGRILGRIRIGNNVSIGANAVVLQDVPDDSVAVGVPARILPRKTDTPAGALGDGVGAPADER